MTGDCQRVATLWWQYDSECGPQGRCVLSGDIVGCVPEDGGLVFRFGRDRRDRETLVGKGLYGNGKAYAGKRVAADGGTIGHW